MSSLVVGSKIKKQVGCMLFWEYKINNKVVRRTCIGLVKKEVVIDVVEEEEEIIVSDTIRMLQANKQKYLREQDTWCREQLERLAY